MPLNMSSSAIGRNAMEITRPQEQKCCMNSQYIHRSKSQNHNAAPRSNTFKRLGRCLCAQFSIKRKVKARFSQKPKTRIRHINVLLANLPPETPAFRVYVHEESAPSFITTSTYEFEDNASTIKAASSIPERLDELLLDSLPQVLNDFNYLARHQQLYVHRGTHLTPSPEALSGLPNAPSYFDSVIDILNCEKMDPSYQDPDNKSCRFHQAFREAAQHPIPMSVDSVSTTFVHEDLTPGLLEESFRVYSRRVALRACGEAADVYRFTRLEHWEQYARIVQEDRDHILYWEPFTSDDNEETKTAWQCLNQMNAKAMQMWFVFIRSPIVPDHERFEHKFHYRLKKGALGLLERNAAQLALSSSSVVDECAPDAAGDADDVNGRGSSGTVIRWTRVLEGADAAERSSTEGDIHELPSTLT